MVNDKVVSNVTGGDVYHMSTVADVKAYFDAGFSFIVAEDADYMTYRSEGYAVGEHIETDSNGDYEGTDGIKLLNLVKEYCDTYKVPYNKAKVLVRSLYLGGVMGGESTHSDGQIKENLTKMYNKLKTFPCFGGLILRDEPRGRMYETYNNWYKWLVNDLGVYRDGYMLYGALLGMNAAEAHVNQNASSDTDGNFGLTFGLNEAQYRNYLDLYQQGLTGAEQESLCFDYYPFLETITGKRKWGTLSYNYYNETSYSMHTQYFQNLEIFANHSKEKGYKRSLCVQSIAFYNKASYDEIVAGAGTKANYVKVYTYHGKVSEQVMTYQLYSALAYGYEKAVYFTYMQPMNQSDSEWFADGAYMWQQQSDGSYKAVPTETYNAMKRANEEIIPFSRLLAGYNWLGTKYSAGTSASANVFNGTSSYSSAVLTSVSSSYDAIAGCLKDGNGNFGFMVVNADDPRLARTNTVTLTFGAGFGKVIYYENGVKKTADLTNGRVTLNIGAGKGVFVIPVATGV